MGTDKRVLMFLKSCQKFLRMATSAAEEMLRGLLCRRRNNNLWFQMKEMGESTTVKLTVGEVSLFVSAWKVRVAKHVALKVPESCMAVGPKRNSLKLWSLASTSSGKLC